MGICTQCGKTYNLKDEPRGHYDPRLRGFSCLVDHDGKLRVKYDENGNEEV
jgi:hypothetical protein